MQIPARQSPILLICSPISRIIPPFAGDFMAYFEVLSDGRHRAHVEKKGVRKSRIFDTKRKAQDWAKRLELEIVAKKVDNLYTFQDLADKYLESVTSGKDGEVWERRRIGYFVTHFGNTPLSEIDSPQIAEWRDTRLKTVQGSTVQREANILRNMFTRAVDEWRWMERNPFKGVQLPKENAPRQAIWRWQEIRRVLRAGQRTGGKTLEVTQAFHISLRTAMRLQEALAAPSAFKPGSKVIALPRTKTAPKGELVPLTRQGYRLMEKVTNRGENGEKTGTFSVSPNEASVLFSKLCRQQLIKGLTFHDARASALTYMSRKMDVLTLGRISRHKDLSLLMNTYFRESAESVASRI